MLRILFVLLSFVLILTLSCSSTALDRPNVILIIIDTLRADHLGCYGYHRDTSPSLDSLAASGTRWEHFQAQAPWTLPATASIFTGLNVKQHGTRKRLDGDHRLHIDAPTIPILFNNAGYRTCGIFNVSLLNADHGFAGGFEHFSCASRGRGRAAIIVDEFLGWLDTDEDDRPFLAVLHFFDVHDPYDPPSPFDTMWLPGDTLTESLWEIAEDGGIAHPEHLEHFLSRYDGEITWVDTELGRLFGELRIRGFADSTIIMVTADHGEEFLERGGTGHGTHFHEELLHVPMFITGPGIPSGETISEPAAQFDILPTLLAICSIENSISFEGVDMFSDAARASRPITASNLHHSSHAIRGTPLASVVYGTDKGIVTRTGSTDSYRCYDLLDDPHELNSFEADSLMIELLDFYRSTPMIWDPPKVQITDSSATQALEDLGYI